VVGGKEMGVAGRYGTTEAYLLRARFLGAVGKKRSSGGGGGQNEDWGFNFSIRVGKKGGGHGLLVGPREGLQEGTGLGSGGFGAGQCTRTSKVLSLSLKRGTWSPRTVREGKFVSDSRRG